MRSAEHRLPLDMFDRSASHAADQELLSDGSQQSRDVEQAQWAVGGSGAVAHAIGRL